MSDVATSQEMHDKLLAEMPDGASHEEADCPFCNDVNSYGGGDTMTKTYTEDELTTAVAAAVAPIKEASEAKVAELESELEDLRAAKADEETASEIDSLKAELEKAELRANEAEARIKEITDYLAEQAELEEVASYLEAVKAERLEVIKGFNFAEERVEANLDRWVAMSDDDFAALVEDYTAIVEASKASIESNEEIIEDEIPSETAMSHTRTEDTASKDTSSAFAAVLGARRAGIDVSKLNV